MKKINFYFLTVSLGLFILLIGCSKENIQSDVDPISVVVLKADKSISARNGNTPSANGQGELIFGGRERHFAFQAKTNKDGSINGSGQLTYSDGSVQIHFSIDCINYIDTNYGDGAILSGTVLKSNLNNIEGFEILFYVVDGGEEEELNPDIMSLMLFAEDLPDCNDITYALANIPWDFITGGNIQVNN